MICRFSKQLNVDIPFFKVLSGASVTDLVEEGVQRLSPMAIPLVYNGDRTEEDSSTPMGNTATSEGPIEVDPEIGTPLTEPDGLSEGSRALSKYPAAG